MKKFRLHWLTGKPEDIEGPDIADAMRRSGYGGGVFRALYYWEEIKPCDNSLEELYRPITENKHDFGPS